MVGLPARETWLIALLLISCAGFWAAARWASRLSDGAPIMAYSIAFSLAFTLLALAAGLAVLR